MKYVKINNILGIGGGAVDYKGLDVNKFIAGSQRYDINNNYCIVLTSEDFSEVTDVKVIIKENYEALKTEIESNIKENSYEPDVYKLIEQLGLENPELLFKLAIAEIKTEGLENDVAELMFRLANIEIGGNI